MTFPTVDRWTRVDIEAPLGSPEKELRSFGGMME